MHADIKGMLELATAMVQLAIVAVPLVDRLLPRKSRRKTPRKWIRRNRH